MAPKRKSDATEIPVTALAGPSTSDADVETIALEPSRKKPRVAVNPTTLETSSDKDKLKSWRDIKLPGEDADVRGVLMLICWIQSKLTIISRAVVFQSSKSIVTFWCWLSSFST